MSTTESNAEEVHRPLAYRVQGLADETGLSCQTIYREIHEGRLKAKRVRGVVMVPRAEVDRWLAEEE